ncbi:hypothetical protein NBRC116595_28390 [Aliiglaciecola sp. NS0011-25]
MLIDSVLSVIADGCGPAKLTLLKDQKAIITIAANRFIIIILLNGGQLHELVFNAKCNCPIIRLSACFEQAG